MLAQKMLASLEAALVRKYEQGMKCRATEKDILFSKLLYADGNE